MRWNPLRLIRLHKRASRRPESRTFRPSLEEFETRLLLSADVLTYHNNNARTGANLEETILTPDNVNATSFGNLFTYPVDGYVYAQPLYKANVDIPGRGTHNVVIVATEHDSVYAFDGDDPGPDGGLLWTDSFIDPTNGVSTVSPEDVGTDDIFPEIGITGTPVIDGDSGTLYVVAKTKEMSGRGATFVQRLHALDIGTGAEKFGGPVEIQATVPGTGDGSINGEVPFDPLTQNQRSGLVLSPSGVIYIAWASHGDNGPYHGWVIGYDKTALQQVAVFNESANGGLGGIWMSGGAPAVDDGSNLYLSTGNGDFDPSIGSYGDSNLKLSLSDNLSVTDFFTPWNQADLETGDRDLGSGGIILLPDQPGVYPHLLAQAGKEGKIYLMNRDDLGQYQRCGPTCDDVVQVLPNAIGPSFDTPAFFNNRLYYQGYDDVLKAFLLVDGQFLPDPVSVSSLPFGFPGTTPSISANQGENGIVWVLQTDAFGTMGPVVLHAYDALDLSNELYNSGQQGPRDELDGAVKFTVPTISNGHVYVGTESSVAVLGLLDGSRNTPRTHSSIQSVVALEMEMGKSSTSSWDPRIGFGTAPSGPGSFSLFAAPPSGDQSLRTELTQVSGRDAAPLASIHTLARDAARSVLPDVFQAFHMKALDLAFIMPAALELHA